MMSSIVRNPIFLDAPGTPTIPPPRRVPSKVSMHIITPIPVSFLGLSLWLIVLLIVTSPFFGKFSEFLFDLYDTYNKFNAYGDLSLVPEFADIAIKYII